MAYANYSASPAAAFGSAITATIHAVVAFVGARIRPANSKRKPFRAVQHLDDHILRDIGLRAEQVRPVDPYADVARLFRNHW